MLDISLVILCLLVVFSVSFLVSNDDIFLIDSALDTATSKKGGAGAGMSSLSYCIVLLLTTGCVYRLN